MSTAHTCTVTRMTPPRAGAVAILQLCGSPEAIASIINHVSNRADVESGRLSHVTFHDNRGHIDDGLIARLEPEVAQLMPHGGPRVLQRMMSACVAAGATLAEADELDPMKEWPEAADMVEALMMRTLSGATSPLAIELLLVQPDRWRNCSSFTDEDRHRSDRLMRLLFPANVVVAGPANVGKSTLSNALLGRLMSITQDLPGTTRDYTTGRVNLQGVVVNWHDTPGLRASDDTIEQDAIALARTVIDAADVLIAVTDAEHDWPELSRPPDLRVGMKSDLAPRTDADLNISATTGDGMPAFAQRVRQLVVADADLRHPGPWRFHDAFDDHITRLNRR